METKKESGHLVLSNHALSRMGKSLYPHEIGDILHYQRALKIGLQDTTCGLREKYCFWNSVLRERMVAVLSLDLCVVTVYARSKPLSDNKVAGDLVSLVTTPQYLPEFSVSLPRKFEITVVAQGRSLEYQKNPKTYTASRVIKAGKVSHLWQALKSHTLRGVTNAICREELDGLVPTGLYIEEVKIPISAVFSRGCGHRGQMVVPWAFRPAS
jgi:hypothetical protein